MNVHVQQKRQTQIVAEEELRRADLQRKRFSTAFGLFVNPFNLLGLLLCLWLGVAFAVLPVLYVLDQLATVDFDWMVITSVLVTVGAPCGIGSALWKPTTFRLVAAHTGLSAYWVWTMLLFFLVVVPGF